MIYILLAFISIIYLGHFIFSLRVLSRTIKSIKSEVNATTSDLNELITAATLITIVPINKAIGAIEKGLELGTDAYSSELIMAREQTKMLVGQALIVRQKYQLNVQDKILNLRPIIVTIAQMEKRIKCIKFPSRHNLRIIKEEIFTTLEIKKTIQETLQFLGREYTDTVSSVNIIAAQLEIEGNKLSSPSLKIGLGTQLKKQLGFY